MGGAKTRLLEEQDHGFRSPGDRHVCADCASEPALASFVRSVADSRRCDYCGTESASEPIATHVDRMLELIAESLLFEYADPRKELPYESAEGRYQGDVLDTEDVLLAEDCNLAHGQLHRDVINAFSGRQWRRREYLQLRGDEALMASWERFSDQVIHRTRYVFLSGSRHGSSELDLEAPGPAQILVEIGRVVSKTGLVRKYPAGTRWFRARPHLPGMTPVGASGLGPPPKDSAAANRMSPAGIPMFYGARESATAVAEMMAVPQNGRYPLATVGAFVSARPSLLVDLTDLTPVPSLFDGAGRHLRAAARFLRAFVDDLSRPVSRDGLEHLEYVPTQVVTEWFRHAFVTAEGSQPDGGVYPSARREGGVCCVLFGDASACCDVGPGWQEDLRKSLALENSETEIVHRGYRDFLASTDRETLRQAGLRALGRQTLFGLEERNDFALRGTRTPEYLEFCSACRDVGARYGLAEWVVRWACLQEDYHPELEPFPIEAAWPRFTVVAAPGTDPLFLQWLLYVAWNVGLRVVYREADGREAVVVSVPVPATPAEPLTEPHRPPLTEAFSWRLNIPASYSPAAASSVAWEAQEQVRELLVRLGYEVEGSPTGS